jgi:hypothetical protein
MYGVFFKTCFDLRFSIIAFFLSCNSLAMAGTKVSWVAEDIEL